MTQQATNSIKVSRSPAVAAASPTPTWSPWPFYDEDELAAVQQVLHSGRVNYWTGTEGRRFEEEYAAALGRRHAVALANGTLALELALRVIGVGPGDEVVVSPRTFIASASCIVMQGARPIFADVDPQSQNFTAETIEQVVGPKTKAIIAVHLGGLACDMDPIMQLAARHKLCVIEDCAQAHGATYRGRPVGALGHMAAFSFCQDKIISTGGEGGMLLLDDDRDWSQAWSFKDHGKSFEAVYARQHPPGFRWLHESFGTNWRMTEMQAAIGRVQLRKLPDWVAARQGHAARLTHHLHDLSAVHILRVLPDYGHAYYRFYFFVRPESLLPGWSRDRILATATAAGVPCHVGSCSEIYREQAFAGELTPSRRLPVAQQLGETSLCLLVHPTLTTGEIDQIGQRMRAILQQATGSQQVAASESRREAETPPMVYGKSA